MLLPHKGNILNKIRTDYRNHSNTFREFYNETYIPFHNIMINTDYDDENQFRNAVQELNAYYRSIESLEQECQVRSQSKLRSTVLEELNTYLFNEHETVTVRGLSFFNKGIFAGLKISENGTIAALTKDVDFCIGKRFEIHIVGQPVSSLIIPIVAIEVKTYLDATMFNEVQYSTRSIKNASPNVSTYIIMERNEVRAEVIHSAKADTPLDEIFVIREHRDSPIDFQTLVEYRNDVIRKLGESGNDDLIYPGRLLNS